MPARRARARKRVAIVERLPAYRRGLAVGFAEHGFDVHEVADGPAGVEEYDVVAVAIDKRGFDALPQVRAANPDAVLIALLDETTAASWRRALRLGANGVVAREAAIEEIVTIAEAALAGLTVLPTDLARKFAATSGEQEDAHSISEVDVGRLRAMAEGATIAKMAHTARYSERQMHRLVGDLYRRLGATNRQEALLVAARFGILD